DALDPERVGGGGGFGSSGGEGRQIRRGGRQIFGERRVHQGAHLVVHDLLIERLRDALGESTVHLSVHDERVDHMPDVVDTHIGADLYLPGFRVDFRGAQMRAVWEREVLRVVGG